MFFFISHSLIDGPSPHPPTRTRTERQCNTVKQAAVLSLLVTKRIQTPLLDIMTLKQIWTIMFKLFVA